MDVIGIGALNLDFIVPRASLPGPLRRRLDERLGENLEALVEDAVVDEFLVGYGTSHLPAPSGVLGGSTFNAIRTIREMELGLRIGYVGVVGCPQGEKFLQYFAKKDIDNQYLFTRDFPSSKCFAEISPTKQRRLVTGIGATRFLVDCIREKAVGEGEPATPPFQGLSKYLASARWVHITSFHDLNTLSFFRVHIQAAKQLNPGLHMSFDPGYQYAFERKPEVLKMARLADFLFLSEEELRQLARAAAAPGEAVPMNVLATQLFKEDPPLTQVVMLKRRSSTVVIRWYQGQPEISRWWHRTLWGYEIKDDVGAGDVFAGGYIAGHLVSVFEEFGRGPLKLAAALVRAKLQRYGDEGYQEFAQIARAHIWARRAKETLNWRDRVSLYAPRLAWFAAGTATGVAGNLVYHWLQRLVP